jgi:hypothetical protein
MKGKGGDLDIIFFGVLIVSGYTPCLTPKTSSVICQQGTIYGVNTKQGVIKREKNISIRTVAQWGQEPNLRSLPCRLSTLDGAYKKHGTI